MKFNHENKTIEMSRTEANKANIYGSEAYKNLMRHKTAMPNYEISIIKRNPPKSKNKDKGLTYSFMKNYILSHDNAEENMKEFENLKKEELKKFCAKIKKEEDENIRETLFKLLQKEVN